MVRLLPLLLLACAAEPTTLKVQVACSPADQFHALSLTLTSSALGLESTHAYQDVSLPDSLVLRVDDRAAEVTITAVGVDSKQRSREGSTTVTTVSHQRVIATVDLSLASTCLDGVKGPDEADIDCGGTSVCPRCATGASCAAEQDCDTRTCADGHCGLASGPPFWREGPVSPDNRYGIGVATVPGLGVLVVGGEIGSGPPVDTVDLYDLSLGAFRAGLSLPAARTEAPAVFARGRLYVLGGYPTGTEVLSWAPGETTWRTEPSLPSASRHDMGVAALGDTLYVMGGWETGNPSDRVDVLRPGDAGWVTVGRMPPQPRVAPALAAAGDVLVLLGGEISTGDAGTQVDRFFPDTGAWLSGPPMHTARYDFPAVLAPDGRVWAIGGVLGGTDVTNAVEALDLDAGRWSAVAPLVSARGAHGAAVLPDGRLFAVGGPYTTHAELYGPVVDVQPRTAHTADTLHVGGDNFAADAGVRVMLEPEHLLLARGSTDAKGQLAQLNAVVPTVDAGAHAVVVTDDRSRYPITIGVVIAP